MTNEVKVLDNEQFMAAVLRHALTGTETDEHRWAVSVASILGVVSTRYAEMSKDEIVALLQGLAIVVPDSVLDESTAQLTSLADLDS